MHKNLRNGLLLILAGILLAGFGLRNEAMPDPAQADAAYQKGRIIGKLIIPGICALTGIVILCLGGPRQRVRSQGWRPPGK